MRQCVKPPIAREGHGNSVWVWKYPLTEHNYIMSADVARGDSKDYSTFHIIDVDEGEVVAEYKGKIRPDNFAVLLNEWGLKYNKALMCPENNSYGFGTILKLLEFKYPKMYYRKKSQGAYLGGYVPPSSAESAGFNTNGKTRNTILGKLEEVLRNKQLYVPSSRFYEEVKTFTWQSGRVQAKKGFNDDLVMSLGIGTWLYDASTDYSSSSKKINSAMINAFSSNRKEYTETPDQVLSDTTVLPVFSSRGNEKSIIKTNLNKALKRSKIPPGMEWILK
jgi:hypothetical protein